MNAPADLREFLKILSDRGELRCVSAPLDPVEEIPEYHRRVVARGGPALLFEHPRGSDCPLVTNLFGTTDRVRAAFGDNPGRHIQELCRMAKDLPDSPLPTLWKGRKSVLRLGKTGLRQVSAKKSPVMARQTRDIRLSELPATHSWPEDGGRFFTQPLVLTASPSSGCKNLGMYRMQIFDDNTTGMHWQIHKGGGFHHAEAEASGSPLPVAVFIGGPPALTLAAIAPLPEDVPELLFASFLTGEKLPVTRFYDFPLPVPASAEYAFLGEVLPGERRPEGPFGDHYGYYSLQHDYPVFHVRTQCSRRDPIFVATVVGEPSQEDYFIGEALQELLAPLGQTVMPQVRELWAYGETGFHSLAAAKVKTRYPREALSTAFRLLGEGQLSLTKVLALLPENCPANLRDFRTVFPEVLARCDFQTDLHIISPSAMDSLDYTGPRINEGSKMIFSACEAQRFELASDDSTLSGLRARAYCPGCLVVQAPPHSEAPDYARKLFELVTDAGWRCIVMVDRLDEFFHSEMSGLWLWFTRFEPAANLYAASSTLNRYHVELRAPVVMDARIKGHHPGGLIPGEDAVRQIDRLVEGGRLVL